jgi:serine/threonine protein kinase
MSSLLDENLHRAMTGVHGVFCVPPLVTSFMAAVLSTVFRLRLTPLERSQNVPVAVSAIIMKLLAKTPEERYQTAAGLESDLRRCLTAWETRREIDDFQLGEFVASQKDREFREQQELLTQAAQKTDQLSEVLYKNGGASYLQVLTSETNYSSSELNLVQAQLNERLALVQLYQALGGRWQQ